MFGFISNFFKKKAVTSNGLLVDIPQTDAEKRDVIRNVLTNDEEDLFRASDSFLVAKPVDSKDYGKYRCSFHSDLTNLLSSQHAVLHKIAVAIIENANKGKFDNTNRLMTDFKSRFQLHCSIENVQVYKYIQNICEELIQVVTDKNQLARFRKYKSISEEMYREMRGRIGAKEGDDDYGIERTLRDFYKKYYAPNSKNFDVSPLNVQQFLQDFRAYVPAIEGRIEKEHNSLYLIYDELAPEKIDKFF